MKKSILIMGMALTLMGQGVYGATSNVSSEGYVTPEWLKAHAGERNILIVDVSRNRGDYRKEHIPNAVFVDWIGELADQREKKYYRVVPKEGFERVMGRIGATHETTLIFYDNLQNRLAIRALWVAEYYGHKNVAVLEGGIFGWKAAGFRVTTVEPVMSPTEYRVREVHSEMNVDKVFVKENLRNGSIVFGDSRPWKMYTGQRPGMIIHTRKEVSRRGHLPGAVHIPWKGNIDKKSNFLDRVTLMKKYGEAGIEKERQVIFYCNEGVHAVYNWFVVTKMLGFKNVRIYEGSMGEWADQPLLPMVSGIGF